MAALNNFIMKLKYIIGVAFLFILVSCKKDRTYVHYNLPFEEVAQIAQQRDKPFCVVLSSGFCPPCTSYIDRIMADSAFYAKEAVFNIVNTDLAENKWYQHWLCVSAAPTTAVFSPEGELLSVVAGTGRSSHDCIQKSLAGETDCMAYSYNPHVFSRKGHKTALQTLNNVLDYRRTGNAENLGQEADYPYIVYLQAESTRDKARAEQFMSSTGNDRQMRRLYADLAPLAMEIIEPGYHPWNDAVLVTDEAVVVDSCRVDGPRYFSITVENGGKKELVVDDVMTSCNCVSLAGDGYLKLAPGETGTMDFVINGSYRGTVKQLVSLYSNSVYNPVQDIEVHAVFPR